MTLAPSVLDSLNRAFAYTKSFGDLVSGVITSANIKRLLVRYFSVVRSFAHRHISHVVVMRPEIKVIGIDAQAVVALVQDERSVGDSPSVNLPRNPVCAHLAIEHDHLAGLIRVSGIRSVASSIPQPATRLSIQLPLGVKTLLEKFRSVGSILRIWATKNAFLPAPALVMVFAKAAALNKLSTICNGANALSALVHKAIVQEGGAKCLA